MHQDSYAAIFLLPVSNQPIARSLIPLLCSPMLYVLSDNCSAEVNEGNILSWFFEAAEAHILKRW